MLVIGAAMLAFLYYLPVLNSGSALGIQDWDQNFAWNEFTRLSLVRYHQFPFWDPYRCGGTAHFANPQIGVLSLTTLFVVLFGTVSGVKISIFIHGLLGLLGFFLLAKQQGLSRFGSAFAAIIYSFSGITASFLSTGMVVFINMAYTPYILYCYMRAKERIGWGLLAGFLAAVSFYFDYHIPMLLVIFLCILSLLESAITKKIETVRSYAIFIGTFILLIFPKLVLSLQLMNLFPVVAEGYSGHSLVGILYYLLSRQQGLLAGNTIRWHIDEASLYIGILPFLLAVCYVFLTKGVVMRHRFLLLWLSVSLWLMLGDTIPVSLYGILHNLPLMESFRVAERYRFLFIVPVALLAGFGVDRLRTLVFPRRFIIIFICIFFGTYADLTSFAANNFLRLPLAVAQKKETRRTDMFSQVMQADTYESFSYVPDTVPLRLQYTFGFTPWSLEYSAIRKNIGVIDCYDSITATRHAMGSDDARYRGEWYLLNGARTATQSYWSPQKLLFVLDEQEADDVLVVNQNYYPGWYVTLGTKQRPAENHGGLLAVSVTAQDREITFAFIPYRYLIDQLWGRR